MHRVFDDGLLDALTLKWSHTVACSLQANTIDFSIDGLGIANHPESGPLKQQNCTVWIERNRDSKTSNSNPEHFGQLEMVITCCGAHSTQVGSLRKKDFKTNHSSPTTRQFNKRLSFTGQFCVRNVVSAISGNWR